jgi:thioesterase domain-containing protein
MYQQALRELNERFVRQIPLTGHMELAISSWDGSVLQMEAPLKPNRNDKGTGFAGSIASLATFAGWALITLAVEERCGAAEVAVYRSEISYRRPIDGDFEARCCLPEAAQMEKFWRTLTDTGKGRLELAVSVMQAGEEKVQFQGAYAVCLISEPD